MDFEDHALPVWGLLILVYGFLVAIGGIIGYAKARSNVSLISGLGSGVALAIASYTTIFNHSLGLSLATAIALFLLVVFVFRWIKTRAIMPAGFMSLLSLIATIVFAYGYCIEAK